MDKKMSDSVEPVDRRKLVYVIFVWLGIGTLLPWNFFIALNSYWDYKYRTVEEEPQPGADITLVTNVTIEESGVDNGPQCPAMEEKNEMQKMWNSRMAVASMIPNVTILILNGVFGHRFKTQPRLLVSLILVILLFGFTAAMAKVPTETWQSEFMTVTIVSAIFININAAIFQGGLLGLAGKFPPAYMGGVFSGQAVGGIFASVTSVVMIALGAKPAEQAFFCFLVAVAFLGGSLVFYLLVTRSEFYQYYLGENLQTKEAELETAVSEDSDIKVSEETKFLNGEKKALESGDGPYPPPVKVVIPRKVNPISVFGNISLYAVSVFLIFGVTLMCFPAITVLVQSVNVADHKVWACSYFIPVCCFVLFNIGDYVGRILAEKIQMPKPGKVGMMIVFGLSVARIIFLPLFLFCNALPGSRDNSSVHFESDTAYIIIMVLFSVSNGYLASICMMSAPKICHPDDQQIAANLMVALLGLGLGTGAGLSNAAVLLL